MNAQPKPFPSSTPSGGRMMVKTILQNPIVTPVVVFAGHCKLLILLSLVAEPQNATLHTGLYLA